MAVATVNLKDGRAVKLGRIRPKALPQALRLSAYLDLERMATPPPSKVDYASKAQAALKRVYLNDQYGDCVIAGKYHQIGVWSANDGPDAIQGTDAEVLQQYHAICGPGDNGCVITDVLDVMKARGLPAGGTLHKIDGYVQVDNTNKLEVQIAIYLFGSLTLGIDLPGAWTCTDCVWTTTNTGIVGGHDVCCVGYDDVGVQIATWGGIVTITWAAFLSKRWISETYAQLSPDWYGSDKLAPMGIDAATLKADLDKLGGGVIPDIDPVPPTPPPVPPGPVPPPPPVPPGPVPPPPPLPPARYTLNLTGSFPYGIAGRHETVKLTGTAEPIAAHEPLAALPENLLVVFLDLMRIYADLRANNVAALQADIAQLLADLGVRL